MIPAIFMVLQGRARNSEPDSSGLKPMGVKLSHDFVPQEKTFMHWMAYRVKNINYYKI